MDDDEPIVLVVGDPIEGFRFYGPTVANDPDLEALTDRLTHETWWYAKLIEIPKDRCERCGVGLAAELRTGGRRVTACLTCAHYLAFVAQNPLVLEAAVNWLGQNAGEIFIQEHAYNSGGWTMCLFGMGPVEDGSDTGWHLLLSQTSDINVSIGIYQDGDWVNVFDGEAFNALEAFVKYIDGAPCHKIPGVEHGDSEGFTSCPCCGKELG